MQRQTLASQAAFLLALALLMFARAETPTAPAPCDNPVQTTVGSAVCGAEPGARLNGPLRRVFGLGLDPNRDGVTALETLPGIGPALAGAIVEAGRGRPYREVSELERVSGIGPSRLRAIAPFLALERPLAREAGSPVKSASCRVCCETGENPVGAGRAVTDERVAEACE